MADRTRKIFLKINIETLLKQTENDFSNENPLYSWLSLEFFEDKDLDIFTAKERMAKAKDKENPERYYVWDENKEEKDPCSLSKIYLLFDAENPFLFCKKVKLACEERESAENIIRYNSYIDKRSNSIYEQRPGKSLQNNIKKLKFLKVEQKNIDDLVRDLNYLTNINKDILEKFLTGIGKGSFNIKVDSKEIYEYLKLKNIWLWSNV